MLKTLIWTQRKRHRYMTGDEMSDVLPQRHNNVPQSVSYRKFYFFTTPLQTTVSKWLLVHTYLSARTSASSTRAWQSNHYDSTIRFIISISERLYNVTSFSGNCWSRRRDDRSFGRWRRRRTLSTSKILAELKIVFERSGT